MRFARHFTCLLTHENILPYLKLTCEIYSNFQLQNKSNVSFHLICWLALDKNDVNLASILDSHDSLCLVKCPT